VHVSAKDQATARPVDDITGGSSLSKEEIDRMVRDAETTPRTTVNAAPRPRFVNNADGLVTRPRSC